MLLLDTQRGTPCLPASLQDIRDHNSFKRALKTHCFICYALLVTNGVSGALEKTILNFELLNLNCLTALHAWFFHNSFSLCLIPDKSDTILLGTRQHSHVHSDLGSVNIPGTIIPLSDHIKVLSVTIDSHLTMEKHVNEVSSGCFFARFQT